MKGRFLLDYLDENNFKKLERSLKKYNMMAYKKLMFDFYPSLRKGDFLGELVSINKHEQTENYELQLPTDNLFVKVYGKVKLSYTVYKDQNVVMFICRYILSRSSLCRSPVGADESFSFLLRKRQSVRRYGLMRRSV